MRNVWLDGIMGVAVGDALGLPVQFTDRDILSRNPVYEMIDSSLFGTAKGTWLSVWSTDQGVHRDAYEMQSDCDL